LSRLSEIAVSGNSWIPIAKNAALPNHVCDKSKTKILEYRTGRDTKTSHKNART
jgi:hypothetical protein